MLVTDEGDHLLIYKNESLHLMKPLVRNIPTSLETFNISHAIKMQVKYEYNTFLLGFKPYQVIWTKSQY
jgi:hypothetical protein